mmetsp:Transcript_20893/g.45327  ORF Transcript_20893/g.45327 Transcript_20893/m.45327 type:complete len:457 (+) Transcript_20893:116-1486(+)
MVASHGARVVAFLVWTTVGIQHVSAAAAASGGSSSGSLSTPSQPTTTLQEGIPRSHNSRPKSPVSTRSSSSSSRKSILHHHPNSPNPPWNPSRNILPDGFLKALYGRIPGVWEQDVRLRTCVSLDEPCRIRQVPGDGNCLFHSISVGLCHAVNRTQWDMKSDDTLHRLYQHSQLLRHQAVACLRDSNRRLCLQGREWVSSRDLVEAAAQQYGLTAAEYCQEMQQESVWGGGPEIVALANVLRRPIHVYELATTTAVKAAAKQSRTPKPAFVKATTTGGSASTSAGAQQQQQENQKQQQQQVFVLRRMACFGSPRFDRCGDPALHILSADSRFPDLDPGHQLKDGNHFLAVFPVEQEEDDDNDNDNGKGRRRKKRRLRGGSSLFSSSRQRRRRWTAFGKEEVAHDSGSTAVDNDDNDDRILAATIQNHPPQQPSHDDDEDESPEEFRWDGGWWRRII